MSLTTESWSSRAIQSLVTATCQLIGRDWKMVNFVLKTRVLDGPNTGKNIGRVLSECMDEWNIKENVQSVVTNITGNIGVAAKVDNINVHVGFIVKNIFKNMREWMPVRPSKPHQVVHADISNHGWGACFNEQMVCGTWSLMTIRFHINLLEMWVVRLALLHLSVQFQGLSFLFRIYNLSNVF